MLLLWVLLVGWAVAAPPPELSAQADLVVGCTSVDEIIDPAVLKDLPEWMQLDDWEMGKPFWAALVLKGATPVPFQIFWHPKPGAPLPEGARVLKDGSVLWEEALTGRHKRHDLTPLIVRALPEGAKGCVTGITPTFAGRMQRRHVPVATRRSGDRTTTVAAVADLIQWFGLRSQVGVRCTAFQVSTASRGCSAPELVTAWIDDAAVGELPIPTTRDRPWVSVRLNVELPADLLFRRFFLKGGTQAPLPAIQMRSGSTFAQFSPASEVVVAAPQRSDLLGELTSGLEAAAALRPVESWTVHDSGARGFWRWGDGESRDREGLWFLVSKGRIAVGSRPDHLADALDSSGIPWLRAGAPTAPDWHTPGAWASLLDGHKWVHTLARFDEGYARTDAWIVDRFGDRPEPKESEREIRRALRQAEGLLRARDLHGFLERFTHPDDWQSSRRAIGRTPERDELLRTTLLRVIRAARKQPPSLRNDRTTATVPVPETLGLRDNQLFLRSHEGWWFISWDRIGL